VLDAATRRLIPGKEDGSHTPGAQEANVVRFIDTMLAAFSFSPPMVFAGGPWSDRQGGTQDFMADFVPLTRSQTYGWQQRIDGFQEQYTKGIALLDRMAGGDFTTASAAQQDSILSQGEALSFTQLLFGHTIDGMYAVPEYGGNEDLVGWRDIYFPGDIQPRGYTDAEVEAAEPDIIGTTSGVVGQLMNGGWEQVITQVGGTSGVNTSGRT
jgi:hypothetical protein